jgi:hypothetical protein
MRLRGLDSLEWQVVDVIGLQGRWICEIQDVVTELRWRFRGCRQYGVVVSAVEEAVLAWEAGSRGQVHRHRRQGLVLAVLARQAQVLMRFRSGEAWRGQRGAVGSHWLRCVRHEVLDIGTTLRLWLLVRRRWGVCVIGIGAVRETGYSGERGEVHGRWPGHVLLRLIRRRETAVKLVDGIVLGSGEGLRCVRREVLDIGTTLRLWLLARFR